MVEMVSLCGGTSTIIDQMQTTKTLSSNHCLCVCVCVSSSCLIIVYIAASINIKHMSM